MEGVPGRGTDAFLEVLDGVTIEQMVARDPRARPAVDIADFKPIQLHFTGPRG
jgi:hypothetical protein